MGQEYKNGLMIYPAPDTLKGCTALAAPPVRI